MVTDVMASGFVSERVSLKVWSLGILAVICLLGVFSTHPYAAEMVTTSLNGSLRVTSWKALRDQRVVKQTLDYSCGVASVATILNEFYGHALTEQDVLDAMAKDGASSFQDLASVVAQYGFKGRGIALSFEDLKKLEIPAVAYLQYRGEDHFSVIRGVRSDGIVHLADPSWGNRQFTQHQFRKMWETREDSEAKGKILLIIPRELAHVNIDETFFDAPKGWRLSLDMINLPRR